MDLTRPEPPVRLTTDGEVDNPMWLPGAQALAFSWLTNGTWALATQAADGMTPPQVLVPGHVMPSSVWPDGRIAAVRGTRMEVGNPDMVIVTVENGIARVEPLLQTPNNEQQPQLSRDGRWLLYPSNVSGQFEIYVRATPGSDAPVPVSTDSGFNAAWHPNGREILFVALRRDPAGKYPMMAAAFTPGSPPTIGRPRELFRFDNGDLPMACTPFRCYDVAPDGQRFYAVQSVASPPVPPVTHINLIQNWFEELKAKVSVKR
jgi:Tol biopolymer transport system component